MGANDALALVKGTNNNVVALCSVDETDAARARSRR
jgi:hypothetical protein